MQAPKRLLLHQSMKFLDLQGPIQNIWNLKSLGNER